MRTNTMARLQVFGDEQPSICDSADSAGMLQFLEDPGMPFMTRRIGHEIVVGKRSVTNGFIQVTRGDCHPAPGGCQVTGGRYLMRDQRVGGRIVGAVNITVRVKGAKTQAVVSNIVVDPGFRRQGVATRLVEEVLSDHPGLRVDSAMTQDGAAFFGYASPSPAPRRARP